MTKEDIEKLKQIIGYSCKIYRIEHNYSVKDVATACGVSSPAVTMFERGKSSNMVIFLWYLSINFDPKIDFKVPGSKKMYNAFWLFDHLKEVNMNGKNN